MGCSCFTVPYLESLSTGELIGLADTYGLDIPPDLERVFIIEELLYLDSEDTATEVEDVDHHMFQPFVELPEHYNISFIEVLLRDPLWAFVFWEIKTHDREQYENTGNFEGYCLRIIPLRDDTPESTAPFIVVINNNDTAQYVGFPPDEGRCFKVELCVQSGKNYTPLAVSRPFRLPPLITVLLEIQDIHRNPLAQLSGINQFSLVHSEDRLLRPREI